VANPLKQPADAASLDAALLTDTHGASRLLCCSKRHIEKLNREGLLPTPTHLGRLIRWDVRELAQWVSAGGPARDVWDSMKESHVPSLEDGSASLAASLLKAAAAKADLDATKSQVKKARGEREILALGEGTPAYVLFQAGQGVRITIEIYEKTIGATASLVNRMVTGLLGGGENKKNSD